MTRSPQSARRKVLVLCQDPIRESLQATAIRYAGLARALSARADVVLASPDVAPDVDLGIPVLACDVGSGKQLAALAERFDVVVTPPLSPPAARAVAQIGTRVVVDLYAPEIFEAFARFGAIPSTAERYALTRVRDALRASLDAGDAFLCGSEQQRDLWTGVLMALGDLDAHLYAADPALEKTLVIVPTGIPASPPPMGEGDPMRQAFDGLSPSTAVALWNGGIHEWLDPVTAIRAMDELPGDLELALVFMGTAPASSAAVTEASRLGLLGSRVFFNEGWVPFDERGAWLRASACAISLSAPHLEGRFAIRTRLFDCLWARLPIVCSSGDMFADLVQRAGLGAVVPAGDVRATANALASVVRAGRDSYEGRFDAIRPEWEWESVVGPLVGLVEASALPREGRRIHRGGLEIRMRDATERLGSHVRSAGRRVSRR